MKKIITILFILLFHQQVYAEVNLRFNPLGLMLGSLNAQLDFEVSENWTVGPSVGFVNLTLKTTTTVNNTTTEENVTTRGTVLGVRANYFFNKIFTDSWYLGPSVHWMNVRIEDSDDSVDLTGSVASLLLGYHWNWGSFNIQLGFGAGVYNFPARSNGFDIPLSGATLAGEFTLGWVF